MLEELNDPARRATKITRSMLDISTDVYGFQDVYIGRLPRMIHEIPEADIWECNPEYTGLIYMYLQGTLNESNISQELLKQVQDDIILVSRLDLIDTYENKKIATCVGFGPTGKMECSDEYDCDELMICDYEPFNVYRKYPPAYVSDFVSSTDRIHEIKFTWTLSAMGTQPINYDIYRMLAGMGNETSDDDKWFRIAEDVEPGIVIYEPYGEYIYRLRVYNEAGEIYSYPDVGKSLRPSPLGKDCCTNENNLCINYNVSGDYGLPDLFTVKDENSNNVQLMTGLWHGSCDGSYKPEETECDMAEDCNGEMCPECIGFNVYGRDCMTGEYSFLELHMKDERLYASDTHGSCIQHEAICGSGYVCDDCVDCTDLHVWDNDIGEYVDFFTSDGLDFQVAIGCPDCVDFNVCDMETEKPVNFVANGQYYVVSSMHGKCGGPVKPRLPRFGVDDMCEPLGPCLDYRVFNKETLMMEDLIDRNNLQFDVSYTHGSCGMSINNPDSGYTCDPYTDCPDCVNLNVWNGSKFVDFFAAGLDVQISRLHGTCGMGVEPPVLPDFGLDCTVGMDCPNCVQLKSYDPVNNEMNEFILSDGGKMFISPVHGSCGSIYGLDCDGMDCPDCINLNVYVTGTTFQNYNVGSSNMVVSHEHDSCTMPVPPVLDFGYTCDIGVDCPDCIMFKVLDTDGTGFSTLSPSMSDNFMIGTTYGGCGEIVPPPVGIEWEYSCIPGSDCPDCIQYNVVNNAGDEMQMVAVSDGYLKIGYVNGSCAQQVVEPSVPGSVLATDDEEGQVTITWTNSTSGYPAPEYIIYRDESVLSTDATSPFVDTVVSGTYDYRVEAYNAYGSASNTDSGTSATAAGVAPDAPTNFNATDDEIDQVTMTWTNSTIGDPVPTYNLYRGTKLIRTNKVSPYVYNTSRENETYMIQAVNGVGSADSNTDDGTALALTKQPFTVNEIGSSINQPLVTDGQPFIVSIN